MSEDTILNKVADLISNTKDQLIDMATKANVEVKKSWTKSRIATEIVVHQDTEEEWDGEDINLSDLLDPSKNSDGDTSESNNTQEGDMEEGTEEKGPRKVLDGIRCGNCSGFGKAYYHESVADVRSCYGAGKETVPSQGSSSSAAIGSITRPQVEFLVDLLIERNMKVDIDGLHKLSGGTDGTASGMIGRLKADQDSRLPQCERYASIDQMKAIAWRSRKLGYNMPLDRAMDLYGGNDMAWASDSIDTLVKRLKEQA